MFKNVLNMKLEIWVLIQLYFYFFASMEVKHCTIGMVCGDALTTA